MGSIIPNMGTSKKPLGLAGALFSQVQLRVLSLVIGHPDRSFQLTEVIKAVGSGRGAVQRVLTKLTAAGIVNVLPSGSRKVYQANRASPIFDELHGLILKTVGLLEPIKNALKKYRSRIDAAFVYGSVARGEDTATSDVDLLIIGRGLAYSEVFAALQRAETSLLRPVNPTLMTPDEWEAKAAGKNAFVTRIMNAPRLFVFGSPDDIERTR